MNINPWLKRYVEGRWAEAAHHLFTDLSSDEASAKDVREFMLTWLNDPQEKRNYSCRHHWLTLSDDERVAALTEIFREGVTFSDPQKNSPN